MLRKTPPPPASEAQAKPKPPSPDAVNAAILVLLNQIAHNTANLEPLLKSLLAQGAKANDLLEKILSNTNPQPPPQPILSSIKIRFKGVEPMPPIIQGPVVLTEVGQEILAEVVGFDQFGNPWKSPLPDWTLTNDDEEVVTLDAATGIITAVANGTANISAELTTAEGTDLNDSEPVMVAISEGEVPVLSAIKVVFSLPGEGRSKQKPKSKAK